MSNKIDFRGGQSGKSSSFSFTLSKSISWGRKNKNFARILISAEKENVEFWYGNIQTKECQGKAYVQFVQMSETWVKKRFFLQG